MQNDNILFSEFKLNQLFTLRNRIVMAPMTRVNATAEFVPTQLMVDYYSRRADAGLIITEGTIISPDARGHDFVPGIFSNEQIVKWREVTDAVHARGGLIFCQLWHVGRVSHPNFLGGKLPVSASETVMTGRISRSELMFGKCRALTVEEISELVKQYAQAAKNAIAAGFDGVEIHGANGYLIDQFLHYHTNLRHDDYGGSVENMARFPLAVVRACGEAVGFERVALRLSPGAYLNEITGDMRDGKVFQYLLAELQQLPIAYLHTGNFDHTKIFPELDNLSMTHFMRMYHNGTLVAAGSYDIAAAEYGIKTNHFDLSAFGRPFIANPDLVSKIRNNEPLVKYDVSMLKTLY
ncbi:MAG TPA: alkene reductase [Gammaproteobacteria bacterium]|nr:alkene reductase [Gammaproteobacteria bacterium]